MQNAQPVPGPNGQQAQPQADQQAQDIEVTLVLKVSQVNTIIAALDELPHKYSRPVIDTISQQAMPQVQSQQAPQGPLTDKTIVQ
jgi:hypothetical protein